MREVRRSGVTSIRTGGVFFERFRDFLGALPAEERRFRVLVIATGAASGLGAALLVRLLRLVQGLAWPRADTFIAAVEATPPWQRALTVTVAGALVVLVSIAARRPLGGHGTAGIIEAIWRRAGEFSLGRALLRGVTTIVVVALGVPLGREGALISTGAGVGADFADRFRLTADHRRILVACGASAGIAAAYNVPIGGAIFGLEVLLGSFALELFGPLVVSSVTATLIARMLVESHPAYVIPYYRLGTPGEVLAFAAVAPALGLAAALYVWGIEGISALLAKVPAPLSRALPVLAAAAVGLLAMELPQILGNGYDSVNQALLGELPWTLLVVLPVAKLVSSALCSGAGIPGGLFTPSLFYGALLGGALGLLVERLAPGAAPPGAYALIGMGAVLAGTTHASISAVLIIFEMTRDYGVILPLMIACVVAAGVARWLSPHSLYTAVLFRRGVRLPELPRPSWMRERPIATLLRPDPATVLPGLPFAEVTLQLLALPPGNDLYVVDASGRYLGALILDRLKGHLPDREHLAMVVAADVMDRGVLPVPSTGSVELAAGRFSTTELGRLPVVDDAGRLIGTLAHVDVLVAVRG